ncbi:hypothetical protein [Schleiferia thermophila]|jgi:hypothetical protein|uniref:Uncharacterized protein n=1 Tax=Schleiferia thermophila TaxID=884107 RepID=A0A369A3L9_9FLAO|nr:hypothetical protein [Schleiferia thermophila]RCX03763.1 hypothetical protein DES35_102218 [Schleiferia thermophila]GCD79997.1 hypothetical protein JCM30197_12440 [Schleiferia thermophila]
MKLSLQKFFIPLLIAFSILFTSCEDEFLMPSPEKVENTQLYSEVMSELFNIWKRVDEALRNPTVIAGGQVSIDQANIAINGSVLVIDFGNIQKLCEDGKTRRGRIEVTLSGIYGIAGSAFQLEFVSYRVNNNPVEGTIGISTKQTNESFILTSSNFTFRDMKFNIESEIFWKTGFLSVTNDDDTLHISFSGTASRNSVPYTIGFNTVTNRDLHVAMSCDYKILSGIIFLQHKNDSSEVILDFIDSDQCNDLVKVHFVNERYNTFIKFSGF